MPKHIHIDRRVLYSFLIGMVVINAAVLLVSWGVIMAGKNDFPPFYASAQMVREGQASRLYDFETENSFVRRTSPIIRSPNNHLPYEILVFLPFTFLEFGTAYVVWTLLSIGMLAVIVLLLGSARPGGAGFSLTFLMVLAFFPVWYCLGQGQDSILLALFFALSFWLWKRGQDDLAGFALALGMFRPQLVLPFVLVAFVGGKWKFVRGFVPGALLVLLLSTCVAGFHGMAEYARILISQGTEGSAEALSKQWCVRPGLMPTLRGLLWMLPSWVPHNVQNLLLFTGTFGALLWAAKRMRGAKHRESFDLEFGLAVAVVTVVSFHSFVHDFSLMILPLLIVCEVVALRPRVTEMSAYTLVTLSFLFFFTPLYLVLIFTDKIGLFVLPTVAFLWLISRWRTGDLPVLAAKGCSAQSISLSTV